MSSLKYPAGPEEPLRQSWSPAEFRHPVSLFAQRVAASGLRSASAVLAQLSRRLAVPAARRARAEQQLEFHAEAGAPEGALYLDGKLVGWLPGVRRL
jgi:hypothetical protein